jgi:hypothetical protein
MAEHRKFAVVLVDNGHGAGADVTEVSNAEIDYDGKEVQRQIR